ncbi:MAG: DUF1549 and DUF1553 domain-containing protein [Pirellulaceae bacterium]
MQHRTILAARIVAVLGVAALLASGSRIAAGESQATAEGGPRVASPPDFRTDVMAVFSKSGCNMGACHGNQNGKGGFFLSLRGQDAKFDYRSATRQFSSRRVNPFDAERSLLLLKAAGKVAHQGGVRFREDDIEYQILRDWIAAGAPNSTSDAPRVERIEVEPSEQILIEPADSVAIRVTAFLSDGTQRDVTRLACYEPSNLAAEVDRDGIARRQAFGESTVMVRYLNHQAPVRLAFVPARPDFAWSDPPAENFIDSLIYDKLRALHVNPSDLCDDTVFMRRAYLDTLGILPTADEARAFVADSHPRKRAALIDTLLARPEFADHWALKWSDILRNEEKVLDATGVEKFHAWIRQSIAEAKPLDQFVAEMVAARGSTYENPPANYYRANRDPSTRGETTARLFLGVRLQCARCHNHPFDRWTQDDYYSWAALFARVDYEIVENKRTDKNDKNEYVGEQIVLVKDEGEVQNPARKATAVPAFLGGATPEFEKQADRLPPLAEWLTAEQNELFVKSQVNFIWYHLMGRGLVDPIDDFRATNPAVNPPLLDALSAELIAANFDLRHMVRMIMNSRVYQLSTEPNDTNLEDESNFSRALVRRLSAEQLLDAQSQVVGVSPRFNGYPAGTRAGQIAGVHRVKPRSKPPATATAFMSFGKPRTLLACECERSNETSLSHALMLISDEGLQQRLTQPQGFAARLAASSLDHAGVIDELFWTALSRPPHADELAAALELFQRVEDRASAVQDLTWALLNAKEFIFRR